MSAATPKADIGQRLVGRAKASFQQHRRALRAHDAAILAPNGDRRRAWPRTPIAVGPGAYRLRVLGVVAGRMRLGLLAGMLYIDEQGSEVGRLDHAGDLAARRTYEKASDFAR